MFYIGYLLSLWIIFSIAFKLCVGFVQRHCFENSRIIYPSVLGTELLYTVIYEVFGLYQMIIISLFTSTSPKLVSFCGKI